MKNTSHLRGSMTYAELVSVWTSMWNKEWVERACVREREGGPLACKRAGVPAVASTTSRGQQGWFGQLSVSGCLCEFPPKVSFGRDLLDLEPRVGIVRILLGAGVWFQRLELKPREGAWRTFQQAMSWGLTSNRLACYRAEPCSVSCPPSSSWIFVS